MIFLPYSSDVKNEKTEERGWPKNGKMTEFNDIFLFQDRSLHPAITILIKYMADRHNHVIKGAVVPDSSPVVISISI
jgi:hypothetical protein